jgi:hypothetical protein
LGSFFEDHVGGHVRLARRTARRAVPEQRHQQEHQAVNEEREPERGGVAARRRPIDMSPPHPIARATHASGSFLNVAPLHAGCE